MEIIGFGLAVLMGFVMGLLGGGGSILTVPILAYLFAVPKEFAPSYSLFVVGITALAGTIRYWQVGQISIRTAIVFGVPSTAAVYATQAWIRPALPDTLFSLFGIEITQGMGLMLLFAIMMLAASVSMIRGRKEREEFDEQRFNYPLIFLEGAGVGLLTGLVGAGGGFMIVPALVVLSRLPMKLAIGTSLMIISVKSLIGFTGALSSVPIDWAMLLPFSALGVVGIVIGARVAKHVSGAKLKPAFGWFVLAMGIFVILKTLLDVR